VKILFPNHPLKSRLPDPDYESEFEAAGNAGFEREVYSLEDLRGGDVGAALQRCDAASVEGQQILHRGWMMGDSLYRELFDGLRSKGYQPFTNPDQYAQAHYLPYAYDLIEGRTPESKWVEGRDACRAWQIYEEMGKPAAIVKDYVKSAKHRWNEACFIPEGATREKFSEIIDAFLQARGNLFEKGIVLRKFHRFVKLQEDLRGQPVHEEYRLFMWNGRLLAATPAVRGDGPFENLAEWESIAQRFQSRFISMDIARHEDGGWMIVEVGDGGVSGLPDSIDTPSFYKTIWERSR
jgi:hypothetical protein